MSVSDMDCSDDEGGNKTNIEMNVKIPTMQPRVIKRPMRGGRITNQVGDHIFEDEFFNAKFF